jgi:hypothetical protein
MVLLNRAVSVHMPPHGNSRTSKPVDIKEPGKDNCLPVARQLILNLFKVLYNMARQ